MTESRRPTVILVNAHSDRNVGLLDRLPEERAVVVRRCRRAVQGCQQQYRVVGISKLATGTYVVRGLPL